MMQIKAYAGTDPAPYHASRAARSSRRALVAWAGVVLSAILVCIFLNLPVYVRSLDQSMQPKLFYFAFMILLFPILLSRLHAFLSYLTSPFGLWALALLALNLLHLASDAQTLTARGEALVGFRTQAIAMVLLLGFAFTQMRHSGWERYFVLLAVIVPGLVIADFLYPGLLYPPDTPGVVLGRASGTFINPTIAGEAIMLVFLLSYPMVHKRYRTALILLAGIAVLVTFTRAAMISWLVVWVFLMLRRRLPALGAIAALAVVALPLAMGGLESYISKRADFTSAIDNIQQRLMFFSKGRIDDDSARERAAVLQAGWDAFIDNPVTGIGAGVTDAGHSRLWPYEVGTHNQLIALAAEYGVAGVIMWLWLLILLVRGRYFSDRTLQASVILLFCAMTFFTHNMFDFPYWLLTFALLSQRENAQGRVVAMPDFGTV
ncbi:O-antigen ligase family protein|uniref:O-antigen ligase family protein n=1 Tax=Noviherbaspirillum sp. L7-7A TaxID=2850560 RepID=UPI001C2C66F1|nr:O-antigen ligase family protein [Noviherbaspirillum sp. L7-7A]MBV0877942.1 O-antigen ligase family protein [Noviherbaspirillum sp. L7-7A]